MGSKNGKPVLRPEDKAALAKSSGHTEDMVEQEFDKFMKEYPDGKLNKASFNKMMSQVPLFDSRRSSAFKGWHANLTSSECAGSAKEGDRQGGETCLPRLRHQQ